MKKMRLQLSLMAFLSSLLCPTPTLFAQTVDYTVVGGNCAGTFTLTLGSPINGKNTYSGTASGLTATISWTGTQWEISTAFGVLFSNSATTALNPPCHTVGTFVAAGLCAGGTVTNSSGACDNGSIPIELVDFKAKFLNNAVALNWHTASEINNLGFQIERSTDAVTFTTVNFVKSKGNSNQFAYYQFIDADVSLGFTHYYRLRQMDSDGSESFSKVISVKSINKNQFSFSPNPTNTNLTINFKGELAVLTIYDLLGRRVLTKTMNADNNVSLIDVSSLQTGQYVLEIKTNNAIFRDKFIKN